MKKYLFILLLIPFMVNAESNYLYNVLKNEAENGGVAKEYIGEHHDSFTKEPTDKIYHWYADNDSDGLLVRNKWNVIFGGYCWQMIRTTDTGGIKMLYNGAPIEGKCIDNRADNYDVVFNTMSNSSLNNVYVSTDYEYNKDTKKYKLSGDLNVVNTLNMTNISDLIGKYTCTSTNANTECEKLKKIHAPYGTSEVVLLPINTDSYTHSNTLGSIQYNYPYGATYVGYMHNEEFSNSTMDMSNSGSYTIQTEGLLNQNQYEIVENDSDYPINFNSTSKQWYTTVNKGPKTLEYKFKIKEDGNYLFTYNNENYYSNFEVLVNDKIVYYIYGTESADYILNNIKNTDTITIKHHKTSTWTDSSVQRLYFSFQKVTNITNDTRWLYSNSVEYKNGLYKLINPEKKKWTNDFSNTHYTCFSTNDTCEEVAFMYSKSTSGSNKNIYYITLKDGETINSYLDNLFHDDKVNKNDSGAKFAIDEWYSRHLIDYENYIEDTIYCNDRRIKDFGYFDSDKGNLKGTSFSFLGKDYMNDLSCYYNTDKFSTNNPKAKLKYPIALATSTELSLLNNDNMRKNNIYNIYTMTPYNPGNIVVLHANGNITFNGTGSYVGNAKPMISLNKSIRYTSGDGSQNSPYIIDYSFSIELDNDIEKGTIKINNEDIEHINKDEKVILSITPKKGYELFNIEIKDNNGKTINYFQEEDYYYFMMPASNVIIKPIFTKKEQSYKFIEGMGQGYNITKDRNLRFRFNMEYNDFINGGKVYIDKELVDPKYYELSEGSTIIIFNDEYSKKLSLGKHEIVTTLSDGSYCSTDFIIKEDTLLKELANPNTSDKIILLLVAILIVSFGIYRYTKYLKIKKITG